MDTDEHRFLFKEETHQIIGCAMEVINTLGHGLLEKPYIERGQVINNLKITVFHVGLILNFKKPKLEFDRIAL